MRERTGKRRRRMVSVKEEGRRGREGGDREGSKTGVDSKGRARGEEHRGGGGGDDEMEKLSERKCE